MNITAHDKKMALCALVLLVPAPSVGVFLALHMGQGLLGGLLWAFAKIWLFLGPLVWLLYVEKERLSLSKAKQGGLLMGAFLGLLMLVIIWGAYGLFAHGTIDAANIQEKLTAVGLTNKSTYLLGCLYWTFINALLEEYVFRFFMFRQGEKLVGTRAAVVLTAFLFTIHHTIALAAYLPLWQNALASMGVFSGSIIWSYLYARYRSIWPGYICHVFADIAVFSIGWMIIF